MSTCTKVEFLVTFLEINGGTVAVIDPLGFIVSSILKEDGNDYTIVRNQTFLPGSTTSIPFLPCLVLQVQGAECQSFC